MPRRLLPLALGLVLLGPVLILPGALNRFVLIKVAGVAAGAGLAMLGRPAGRLPRWVSVVLAGSTALLVCTALVGAQPLAQLVGRAPRFEGVAVLAIYLLAGVSGARLLGPARSTTADRLVAQLFAWAAIAVGTLGILESLGFTPLSSSVARPGSLFGNASDQGAWAALVLGPLFARAIQVRDPLIWSGLGAAGLAIATSGSRGALAAGLVVLLAVPALWRDRRAWVCAGGLATAIMAATLLLPVARSRVLGDNALASATVTGRRLLWQETWTLFRQHPLTGVGPSGFGDAVVGVHTGGWYQTTGTEVVDSPHSWPLQALLAGGPLLMISALVLVVAVVRSALKTVASDTNLGQKSLTVGMLAGLLGYGTALLVHLTSPGPTLLAAVFGGALLAAPCDVDQAAPTAVSRIAAGCAGVLAAALLVGALAELPLKSALVAAERGDLVETDRQFSWAQQLRPWDRDLPAMAGHAFAVLASSGNSEAALRARPWLASARAGTPQSVAVLADLATVAETQGDLETATAYLDEAMARDGNNPQLLLQRGVLYAEQRDFASAERSLLRAADLAPHSPDPWTDLAMLYQLQGRTADAADARARAAARSAG